MSDRPMDTPIDHEPIDIFEIARWCFKHRRWERKVIEVESAEDFPPARVETMASWRHEFVPADGVTGCTATIAQFGGIVCGYKKEEPCHFPSEAESAGAETDGRLTHCVYCGALSDWCVVYGQHEGTCCDLCSHNRLPPRIAIPAPSDSQNAEPHEHCKHHCQGAPHPGEEPSGDPGDWLGVQGYCCECEAVNDLHDATGCELCTVEAPSECEPDCGCESQAPVASQPVSAPTATIPIAECGDCGCQAYRFDTVLGPGCCTHAAQRHVCMAVAAVERASAANGYAQGVAICEKPMPCADHPTEKEGEGR